MTNLRGINYDFMELQSFSSRNDFPISFSSRHRFIALRWVCFSNRNNSILRSIDKMQMKFSWLKGSKLIKPTTTTTTNDYYFWIYANSVRRWTWLFYGNRAIAPPHDNFIYSIFRWTIFIFHLQLLLEKWSWNYVYSLASLIHRCVCNRVGCRAIVVSVATHESPFMQTAMQANEERKMK